MPDNGDEGNLPGWSELPEEHLALPVHKGLLDKRPPGTNTGACSC